MSTTVPEQVCIWKFSGKDGNLRSQNVYTTNSGYSLFCQSNNKYLTYVKTNVGINMGFKDTADDKKIHLRLPDGSERDILTGEPFALGLGGSPSFLRYAERTMGINLKYQEPDKPIPEWYILGPSGEKGQPIPMNSLVAIANANVKPEADFLVYLDRPAGADIGWTTSPEQLNLFDAAVQAAIAVARNKILG